MISSDNLKIENNDNKTYFPYNQKAWCSTEDKIKTIEPQRLLSCERFQTFRQITSEREELQPPLRLATRDPRSKQNDLELKLYSGTDSERQHRRHSSFATETPDSFSWEEPQPPRDPRS